MQDKWVADKERRKAADMVQGCRKKEARKAAFCGD